ncbi:MAG: hypothetical protein QOH88_1799 [Verrucomicrobiota bacterium]
MSLLENAVTSLRLALEDFASTDEGRLLSAIRNLHAGILLLFKEKLRRLSPPGTDEVLVKQRTEFRKALTGELISVGAGKKTVTVFQIKERFRDLGIEPEWKRFDAISSLRTDIEHYFSTASRGAMEGAVSNTFLIIRDFITIYLGESPQALLGDVVWTKLLETSEVFEKEHTVCQQALLAIDWQSDGLREAVLELTCGACGSSLLTPLEAAKETDIQCRSCGGVESFEQYAERALTEHFASPNHYAVKEGCDPVLIHCPHCGEEGYLSDENRCAICGETCARKCSCCGQTIPASELSDGDVCGYCDHMMSKDD